jgi:hypothetical protein
MKKCKCGSYAINPCNHGRDANRNLDLCDVCYWREEANKAQADKSILFGIIHRTILFGKIEQSDIDLYLDLKLK